MKKNTNLSVWEELTLRYSEELITSTEDIHFGVGIPGNHLLNLIPPVSKGKALDVGCGSGENLAAIAKLGYRIWGIDGSESQLRIARQLLESKEITCELLLGDVCSLSEEPATKFDLLLCVGVAHFCSELDRFIAACANLIERGGVFVLSVPHPLDMIVSTVEKESERLITVSDYYPPHDLVNNAHYWTKFAGHLELATGLLEYVCRPSDLVNGLITHGFRIDGVWEPRTLNSEDAPCIYKNPDAWFVKSFYPRIPQYLIIKATCERR